METSLVLIPEKEFKQLKEIQEKILSRLNEIQLKPEFENYLTEKQASELIGKKTTWFWQMRNEGKLPFSKIGKKTFYKKEDLLNLIKPK